MSEFKWVPEVGMRVKVGSHDDPDYVGVLLPEYSCISNPKDKLVIFSERRKKILSWVCSSVKLTPIGKRAEKHYAKAKKEWEDAQVIGAGDWVERINRDNSSVKVGDILKCISSASGFICVDNESPDERHFTEYFRKLTPAEVEAHEASLVPEFEVGSYWVLLEDEEHYMKKDSVVRIESTTGTHDSTICVKVLNQTKDKSDFWYTSKTNLRQATPEEIKAATRTVYDLDRGDRFFYLTPCGDARPAQWVCSAFDFGARERGNIFLTREEAEAEDARRVADNARTGGGL